MDATDYLTKMSAQGAAFAEAKYAGTLGDAANYMFSSHDIKPGSGFLAHAGETLRYMALGDPVTAYHQLAGNTHKLAPSQRMGFLESTFLPGTGVTSKAIGAGLSYGVPIALTAHQYFKTPEAERKYHRGETWGSLAGNIVGGAFGGRLGMLGGMAGGGAGGAVGGAIGRLFDPKAPRGYGVKAPALSPTVQAIQRGAPVVGQAVAGSTGNAGPMGT